MHRDPRFFAGTLIAVFALVPWLNLFGVPASKSRAARKTISLDAGLSGSWEDADHELKNRADIQISAFDASLRAIATDLRSGEAADCSDGSTDFAFGAYHKPTDSRLLIGVLETTGLTRRTSSPFGRTIPFPDDRRTGEVDLDPDASGGKEPSFHAAVGTPRRLPLRALFSATIDGESNYVASATGEAAAGRASFARVEGCYAFKELEERDADSWFSERPPLPARPLRFYAAGAELSSPAAVLACDGALSDVYAEGAGAYGNAALRLGDVPWRFSVAAEAASPRYTGPDGDRVGLGFRSASRIERASKRSAGSYVRGDFRTAHPYAGAPPEGFEAALSARPAGSAAPIRLERTAASGEWSVDGGRPLIDAARFEARTGLGPVDLSSSLGMKFEPSPEGLGGRLWDSTTIRIGISADLGPFDILLGLGKTIAVGEEDTVEATVGASVSFRRTAFGFRYHFEEVPGPSELRLWWRIRERARLTLPFGRTS